MMPSLTLKSGAISEVHVSCKYFTSFFLPAVFHYKSYNINYVVNFF